MASLLLLLLFVGWLICPQIFIFMEKMDVNFFFFDLVNLVIVCVYVSAKLLFIHSFIHCDGDAIHKVNEAEKKFRKNLFFFIILI